jgi:hypothetical protein
MIVAQLVIEYENLLRRQEKTGKASFRISRQALEDGSS